jgi:hypothetical protein
VEGYEIVAIPETPPDAGVDVEAVVPLARVTVQDSGRIGYIENLAPRIGLDATRITRLSWSHGGEYTVKELQERPQLRVTFDRAIRGADGDRHGIGENTFLLTARRAHGPVTTVTAARTPHLIDGGRTAVFELPRQALEPEHPRFVGSSTVHVELLCDFLLDERGSPVSGRYLGGRLPSGDGRPGGTFESWFHVRHG